MLNSTADRLRQYELLLQNENGTLKDLFDDLFENFTTTLKKDLPESEKNFKISLYALAIAISLFGNLTLIFVILSTKSLRTKFNFFVLNLAFVDLLIPSTCMWLHLIHDINRSQWTLGAFFCKINTFMQVLVVSVSTFTLTLAVVDRYLATTKPALIKYTQGHQVAIIIIIWFVSTILALPWAVYTYLVEFNWILGHESICQAHFPSMTSRKIYVTILAFIGYFVPLVIMFVLVILAIQKRNRPRQPSLPITEIRDDMKRKALHLVLTVLIVFFLCWTPQQFILLWDVYRERKRSSVLPKGIKTFTYYSYFVAYSSSCIYPFIYMGFNKGFRHAFWNIVMCKRQSTDVISVAPVEIENQDQVIELQNIHTEGVELSITS